MAKLRLSFTASLVIVGVTTFLVFREQSKLREENRLLRQQMEQLAPLQAENDHLSNLLSQANSVEKLSSTQTSELLRLRGEVANLRRQTNELGRLQAENQRLHSSLLGSRTGVQTPQSVPKESWSLAGYADPESAFQSAVWAMSQGDAKTFRASLAPGGGEFAEWVDKPDTDLSARLRGEAEKVTAFKIIGKEAISDDTAILTVIAEGINGNEVGKFRLERIGHDWRLDGTVKEGGPPGAK